MSSDDDGSFDAERERRQREKRETVKEMVIHWKETGPYTFDAVAEIMTDCRAAKCPRLFMKEHLNEVAHFFEPAELRKLNQMLVELPVSLQNTWVRVSGTWHYNGDPQLLSEEQLKVIADSPFWHLCLANVGERGRLPILKTAAAFNRKHVAPWPRPRVEPKRDVSPNRKDAHTQ